MDYDSCGKAGRNRGMRTASLLFVGRSSLFVVGWQFENQCIQEAMRNLVLLFLRSSGNESIVTYLTRLFNQALQ